MGQMMNDNGLQRVEKRMKAVVQASRNAAKKAMEKSADEIITLMKSIVRVDEGDLRDSIGWTWGSAPKGSMKIATVKSSDSDLIITIFAGNSEAYYAHWIEFGTRKTAAQPFFFVSYRANRNRAKSRITREVRKAAKEAWNGIG